MPSFSITMDIDSNGVVVAVCKGRFSAEEWVRQRRLVFESRYRLEEYDGLPVVNDLRECELPAGNWAYQFQLVGETFRQRRLKPFRRALIIGDKLGFELAVSLFAEYQRIFHHPETDTRAFHDFDEGYAWALAAARTRSQA